jgi:hypothetical protein
MSKKPQQTTQGAEIKRQLEAITGHEIDVSADMLLKLWYPAGAYNYAEGNATWRSILFPGKRCNAATLLDASGVSSTGSDGKRVFLLSDFVCFAQLNALAEPINVVATPRSETPFFLTMTHALNNTANDVQITVFAWDSNGTPAPNVIFDWRCRVVSVQIIG